MAWQSFCRTLLNGILNNTAGLEVIKLEFILKLKIKHNDWLLADVSASSQSSCFILSLRLYSSFITSRPEWVVSTQGIDSKDTRTKVNCSNKLVLREGTVLSINIVTNDRLTCKVKQVLRILMISIYAYLICYVVTSPTQLTGHFCSHFTYTLTNCYSVTSK